MEEQKESKEQLMESLSIEINNCKKCDLWKTRNKPLVGDGSVKSKILVIGESPGYYEDLQGKAFVGEAGKILDSLLDLVNLKRKDIYITNVLKCHPPRNHNPNRQEIDSCIGYLYKQIEIIKPRIILTLGKFASKEILVELANYMVKYMKLKQFLEQRKLSLYIILLLHAIIMRCWMCLKRILRN